MPLFYILIAPKKFLFKPNCKIFPINIRNLLCVLPLVSLSRQIKFLILRLKRENKYSICPDPSRWLRVSAQSCMNAALLYTSDAADDLLCVDLGGRRIIKKKKK